MWCRDISGCTNLETLTLRAYAFSPKYYITNADDEKDVVEAPLIVRTSNSRLKLPASLQTLNLHCVNTTHPADFIEHRESHPR